MIGSGTTFFEKKMRGRAVLTCYIKKGLLLLQCPGRNDLQIIFKLKCLDFEVITSSYFATPHYNGFWTHVSMQGPLGWLWCVNMCKKCIVEAYERC